MINECVKTGRRRFQEFFAKSREILPSGQQFTKEEFGKRQRERRELFEASKSEEKELQTKILAMLTTSQSERLNQIQLQTTAVAALARPEIVKALDISQKQSEKIHALSERRDTEMLAKLPARASLSPKEYRQKIIEFRKESDKAPADARKEVLEILTPEQRARFEMMLGKKIEVTWDYDSLIPEDMEF